MKMRETNTPPTTNEFHRRTKMAQHASGHHA